MTEQPSFTQQRFQVITSHLEAQSEREFSDAYVFAWAASVYPVWHDRHPLHGPYAHQFAVGRDVSQQLGRFLGDRWLQGQSAVPSFYDLEERYDVGAGTGFWTRPRLIKALRYTYLSGRFDDAFWSRLNSRAPAAAYAITSTFNPLTELLV